MQQKYGLTVNDYINYLYILYNKKVHVEDCEYKGLSEIHNQFLYNLRITDKQLAEMLETILCFKAFAVNWENSFNFRIYICMMEQLP